MPALSGTAVPRATAALSRGWHHQVELKSYRWSKYVVRVLWMNSWGEVSALPMLEDSNRCLEDTSGGSTEIPRESAADARFFFSFFTASTFFHKRSYHKINNMHTKKKYHGFAGLKVSARQTFFCLFPGIVTYRSKKIEVFGFVLSTFLRFWFCFVYFFDEMHEYKSTRKITIERYYRFLNRTCTASFSLFSCVCMNTMGKQIAYNYQCIQHFAEQFIKCNI